MRKLQILALLFIFFSLIYGYTKIQAQDGCSPYPPFNPLPYPISPCDIQQVDYPYVHEWGDRTFVVWWESPPREAINSTGWVTFQSQRISAGRLLVMDWYSNDFDLAQWSLYDKAKSFICDEYKVWPGNDFSHINGVAIRPNPQVGQWTTRHMGCDLFIPITLKNFERR